MISLECNRWLNNKHQCEMGLHCRMKILHFFPSVKIEMYHKCEKSRLFGTNKNSWLQFSPTGPLERLFQPLLCKSRAKLPHTFRAASCEVPTTFSFWSNTSIPVVSSLFRIKRTLHVLAVAGGEWEVHGGRSWELGTYEHGTYLQLEKAQTSELAFSWQGWECWLSSPKH